MGIEFELWGYKYILSRGYSYTRYIFTPKSFLARSHAIWTTARVGTYHVMRAYVRRPHTGSSTVIVW